MRFLLDENIPGETGDFLRASGHTAVRSFRGTGDRGIFTRASAERAILVTRDSDFLRFAPVAPSGIIYLHIHPSIAEHITEAVRWFLAEPSHPNPRGKVIILRRDGYKVFR